MRQVFVYQGQRYAPVPNDDIRVEAGEQLGEAMIPPCQDGVSENGHLDTIPIYRVKGLDAADALGVGAPEKLWMVSPMGKPLVSPMGKPLTPALVEYLEQHS